MIDIAEDVDETMFVAAEEELMREAEWEHLQCEAEIALNTRVHGDKLLPFFDTKCATIYVRSATPSVDSTDEGKVSDVQMTGSGDTYENAFSVMSKQLWKTLHEQARTELDKPDDHVGKRTAFVMFGVLEVCL